MEAHLIRPAHFTGMTCTAYERRESSGASGFDAIDSTHEQQLHFRCTTGTLNMSLNAFPLKVKQIIKKNAKKIKRSKSCSVILSCYRFLLVFILQNAVALASVSLPPSLFPPNAPTDCKLQFVAFRTGRFFPFIGNSSSAARRRSVNTPVIYVGLGELPVVLGKLYYHKVIITTRCAPSKSANQQCGFI